VSLPDDWASTRFFGATEFRQFVVSTERLYQIKDFTDSYIFTLKENTALFPILAIAAQILSLTWCCGTAVANRDFSSRRQLMIQLVFTALSVFWFRSALGRSDESHIQYSSTFALVGLAFPIYHFLEGIRLPTLNLFLLIYLSF
jgi:ABC-type polysaccharide/polyol phosphate export permease